MTRAFAATHKESMPRRTTVSSLATVGLLLHSTAVGAQVPSPPTSPSLEAYLAGIAAVEASADELATRGLGLDELSSLTLWMRRVGLQRFQSPSPEPPFDTLRSEDRVAFDIPGERVGHEFRSWWPDFVRHANQVATPEGGVVQDFNSGEVRFTRNLTPAWLSYLRPWVPHLVIRDALANRTSVRLLGRHALDGEEVLVVTYVRPDGTQAALFIAASGPPRLLAYETLYNDLRHGDAARRTRYHDYGDFGGVLLPGRITEEEAGTVAAVLHLDSASVGQEQLRSALAVLDSVSPPAAEAADSPAPAVSSGAGAAVTIDTVAPGVYLAAPGAAPNYRILFVDIGGSLVAVEAPSSRAATRAAIDAIRDVSGGLPIRYAAITHHHSDHSAGLAEFAEEGATLLTTAGNVHFVRDLVTAPRSLTGAEAGQPRAHIEVVDGSRTLGSGDRQIVLRDVGPHPHAEEHLVALLPELGLVFQGDLVQFPHTGEVEPARAQTRALVELLRTLPWEVQWIAGVHGRIGTPADLQAAVEAGRAPR